MKIADKRKRFYTKIYVYKQRRKYLKDRGKNVLRYTSKISQWNHEIRRMDERTSRIKNLISAVNEYFEVDIKARNFNKKHKLARNIFYKYGMEHSLEGTILSFSLGRSRGKTAGECRLRFTKSFKFNPENKKIYHQFKTFMEVNAQKAA